MAELPPPGPGADPWPEELAIVLVDREEIARLHGEFCGDPAPTDVITFRHGEIVICPDVAAEQGRDFQRSAADEVLLYGIHGMLHLLGYDDHAEADYERMAAAQERVFQAVLAAGADGADGADGGTAP